ncbi:MAG TPA: peptide chain release factor N(5)-glutamine methyltransferase [Armatimonadota bacterium]|jgi:release factor glutamine methyltransferase
MSLSTVAQLLGAAEAVLREAGVDTPALDARLLAQAALKLSEVQLITERREVVPEPLAAALEVLILRRVRREPLQHVLGRAEFYGRSFFCDARALIPRADTETLIEAALPVCAGLEAHELVVDVGTGSGALAVTLAAECPHLTVWATDVSPAALHVARTNARCHGVGPRVHFESGSCLEPLLVGDAAESVAVVVSNPPYIRSGELAGLQPEVRDWEPRLALDGGAEGLDVYRELLAQCAQLPSLRAVFLEVGFEGSQAVCVLARQALPGMRIEVTPDLAGIPRVVAALRDAPLLSAHFGVSVGVVDLQPVPEGWG